MSDDGLTVTLDTDSGAHAAVTVDDELARAASAWAYVVRNRRRWVGHDAIRRRQIPRAKSQLARLGLGEDWLKTLVDATLLEVQVPLKDEGTWAARLFPWEYVVTTASDDIRKRPLTVVRSLGVADRRPVAVPKPPHRVLIVESAPGSFRSHFGFEGERRVMHAHLRSAGLAVDACIDPTREELAAVVAATQPVAIHLSAVDTHEAARLLGDAHLDRSDGILLSDERGAPDAVSPAELATLLTAGNARPRLLTCNAYNSAAGTCALAVGAGVGAAIGFQDEFDNSAAEILFLELYQVLPDAGWDARVAFHRVFDRVRRRRADITGSGVVLWSAERVPSRDAWARKGRQVSSAHVQPALPSTDSPPAPGRDDARAVLDVEVRVCPHLNCALLHNGEKVFEAFRIRRLVPERIAGVDVEVLLYVGANSFPYRTVIDLSEAVEDLTSRIHFPLGGVLGHRTSEGLRTAVYTQVAWGGQVVHRNTHQITLLPLDEWVNNERNRVWLPSFVAPHDAAVRQVIERALRYLRAIEQDGAAGFAGYQQSTTGVDRQVQAIWSALAYEYSLAYISPPPSYGPSTQRLRGPSAVLQSRAGTCIDLALLLSACLEYVELAPVIFLMDGHALPGYWRTPDSHAEFLGIDQERPDGGAGAPAEAWTTQQVPWEAPRSAHAEIVRRIREKELAAIETVALTRPGTREGGFASAQTAGLDSLTAQKFLSMIDIVHARRHGVTPLPLVEA